MPTVATVATVVHTTMHIAHHSQSASHTPMHRIACIDEIYPLAACLPLVEIGLVACDHRDTTAQVVLLLRSRIAVVYSQSTKADTLEVDKTLQPTHS